jgi:hypothetical protein
MFCEFSRPSSGAHDCSGSLWFYLLIVVTAVLCSWSNTARLSPRYEGKIRGCHCSHELLMMDGRTPKTCWDVNKCQDNKLEICCIWLVIYLNCFLIVFVNGKFKIISEHLAVDCLKIHIQHIPEQTENNSRIIIISRFSHIAILQTEKLASVLLPSHVQGTVLITYYVERIRLVIWGLINIILWRSTDFFLFPKGAANWHKGRSFV